MTIMVGTVVMITIMQKKKKRKEKEKQEEKKQQVSYGSGQSDPVFGVREVK